MILQTGILVFAAGLAAAQGLSGPAPLGCFADEAGRLRQLRGVAGNFIVGEPAGEGVESAACTDSDTVIRTSEALVIRREGEEEERAPHEAVFGLTPRGRAFTWAGEAPGSGEVLTVANPAPGVAVAVVRREGRLLLVRFSPDTAAEQSEQALEGIEPPVLLLPDGRLARVADGKLILGGRDGAETSFELPGAAAAIEPVSRDWIRIRIEGGGGSLLLRLGGDGERLYRMPEVER